MSILKKIFKYITRLTTGKKIFLGYLLLAAIGIITSLLNLRSLSILHNENEIILNRDIQIVSICEELIDAIIDYELYVKKYAILNTPETLNLMNEKNEDIIHLIQKLSGFFHQNHESIDQISSLFTEFSQWIRKPGIIKTSKDRIEEKRNAIISFIKDIRSQVRMDQKQRIEKAYLIVERARKFTITLGVVGLLFVVGIAMLITRHVSKAMWNLQSAIQEFSQGKFDYTQTIKTSDEFGALSFAFSEMSKRLKQLEEMYLDASPLTRFPGGIAIENVLRKRIETKVPFAFCLLDMDNFKSFNDKYGYHRGSEVIKALARIIETVVKEKGSENDFIGHIGGDDFVIITSPERYSVICGEIIHRFDNTITDYYDPEDRRRGYITGKTRQGSIARFPIVSLSIVVVNSTQTEIVSPVQVGEIAAELKEYAKSIPGSTYIVDKRTGR